MTKRDILINLMKHESNRIVWLVAGPPGIPKFGLSRFDLKEPSFRAPSDDLSGDFDKINRMYQDGLLYIEDGLKPDDLKVFLNGRNGAFILRIHPSAVEMIQTELCIGAGI